MRLNGNEPESLAATTLDPFSGVFVLRGPPAAGRADSHLLLTRRRYVGRGMREDIEIANFGEEATFCSVEIQLGADFADLFEVKEGRVEKHGRLTVQHENGRVTFSYTRGAFRRATFVDFSEVPRIAGEHVSYEVIIPARGTWSTCMQVTPVLDTQEITPRYVCGQPVERSTPVARLEQWTRRLPVVSSDHDQFRELLQRSDARPGRAAHLRPRVPRPRGRRGGRAVVHDAVRPRLAAHVVDDDARGS